MLLEGAFGDAYGAGFEFADPTFIEAKNTLTGYVMHPLGSRGYAIKQVLNGNFRRFDQIFMPASSFRSRYRRYTDDTQMALAIAELLVEKTAWTELIIANTFVEVFKRDPHDGYAFRFQKLLIEVEDGKALLQKIIPKSERNGAAMRAYPLGVLKNEQDILEKATIQAGVTHYTKNAIISAQAIALSSHYFIFKKGKKQHLLQYLSDIQQIKWKAEWQGAVEINAIQTVEAVLTLLKNSFSLKELLRNSVDLGGDVDTVASLTLAIGSVCIEIENDLPKWLHTDLENSAFGRDYLIKIDEALQNII